MIDRDHLVTPDDIRDISEAIYRLKLTPAGITSMLRIDAETNPNDNGAMLRRRAEGYDRTTRDYLEVLGFNVPERTRYVPSKGPTKFRLKPAETKIDPGYVEVEPTEASGLFE